MSYKKIIRSYLMIFISIILVIFCIPLFISIFDQHSGICIERGVALSDKELMEIALEKPFGRAYKLNIDDSIESYLINHPNCCKIFREKELFNLYGLLPGNARVSAGFKTNRDNTVYFFEAKVNSCGEILTNEPKFEIEETASPDLYFN